MGDRKSVWTAGEVLKKLLYKKKIASLSFLVLLTGSFFSVQSFGFPEFSQPAEARTKSAETLSEPLYAQVCVFGGELTGEYKLGSQADFQNDLECNSGDILSKEIEKVAIEKQQDKQFEEKLYALVGEAPIKEMIPTIVKFDKPVAAYIVGIARKESSWGQHRPSLEGQNCFNYWGLKGTGSRGVGMGYACFASPEEGAQAVGNRITKLVDQKIDTPSEMVVWKCGRSCAGHAPGSPEKWISDVASVYNKIMKD